MKTITIEIKTTEDGDSRTTREIYKQILPIDSMLENNPLMVEKIISVVNNLPFPITFVTPKND
jgi:hypothetical protein